MSSSVSRASASSLRKGPSLTAGRPGGSMLPHVPAAALDAENVDLLTQQILGLGLDRGVAAAMQHQRRVAAQSLVV